MLEQIAVIGARGKMGTWFTNYFARRGMKVSIFDIKNDLQFASNVRIATKIIDCVTDADLVLVCVPVNATPQVVRDCAKSMKAGAVIAEISSVKHKVFIALKNVRSDLHPLCIHPMFGPGATEKIHANVLLIPIRSEERERKIVNHIFENAVVKVVPDPKTHDRSIAIILGLTYFANIAFAKVISKNDLALLKQISGTTFRLQSLLAESVMTDETALIIALIKENSSARKYIRNYIKAALDVEKLILAEGNKGLESDLQKTRSRLQKQQDLQKSYRRLYEIVRSLE